MAVVHLSSADFQSRIIDNKEAALVDFWASWCGPCKMLSPVIDELSEDLSGKLLVAKVNVDEVSDVAARYNVMSIPTIVLFQNGEEAGRVVGAVPKQRLLDLAGQAGQG